MPCSKMWCVSLVRCLSMCRLAVRIYGGWRMAPRISTTLLFLPITPNILQGEAKYPGLLSNTTVVIEKEQPGDVCNDTDERPPGEHVGTRTRPDAGETTQACKAGGQRRAVALPPRSGGPSPDRQPPRAFERVQRPGGRVGLGGVLLFFSSGASESGSSAWLWARNTVRKACASRQSVM
jgi:hypothetical protein